MKNNPQYQVTGCSDWSGGDSFKSKLEYLWLGIESSLPELSA